MPSGVHGPIIENHGDVPFAKPEDLGRETAAGIVRVNQWTNPYVGIEGILEGPNADAVIVTGQHTGDAADLEELSTVRAATELPLLVGSGVTRDNVAELLALADGVIVASALKEDGVWWNPVSAARVRAFMEVVSGLAAGG